MTRFPNPRSEGKDPLRQLVEECFRREAGFSVPIPGDDVDLIENGILDSMAWVSLLRTGESASGRESSALVSTIVPQASPRPKGVQFSRASGERSRMPSPK